MFLFCALEDIVIYLIHMVVLWSRYQFYFILRKSEAERVIANSDEAVQLTSVKARI